MDCCIEVNILPDFENTEIMFERNHMQDGNACVLRKATQPISFIYRSVLKESSFPYR